MTRVTPGLISVVSSSSTKRSGNLVQQTEIDADGLGAVGKPGKPIRVLGPAQIDRRVVVELEKPRQPAAVVEVLVREHRQIDRPRCRIRGERRCRRRPRSHRCRRGSVFRRARRARERPNSAARRAPSVGASFSMSTVIRIGCPPPWWVTRAVPASHIHRPFGADARPTIGDPEHRLNANRCGKKSLNEAPHDRPIVGVVSNTRRRMRVVSPTRAC